MKKWYQYIREIEDFYDPYSNKLSNFLFHLYIKIRNKLGKPIKQFSPIFKTKKELIEWDDTIGFEQPYENKQILCYYLTVRVYKGNRSTYVERDAYN